jgi:hypothetical protein
MGATGLEHGAFVPQKAATSRLRAAESGAVVTDSRLEHVVRAWSELPESIREAILLIVEAVC